jgi:23S rRNA (guanosine2251-2'-O)-methyltransferase
LKKLNLQELKRLSPDDFKKKEKLPLQFCADNIRSGHNIGSLFRIADAFAMEQILLSEYCVKPPHPEIEKTALGSTNSVKWFQSENLINDLLILKNNDYLILGIEQTDQSVLLQNFNVDTTKKYVFILGNEVKGIQESILQVVDYSIVIPQFGTKHSLNVSVAAGIIAWHFAKEWH